jgi:hypothetical protein
MWPLLQLECFVCKSGHILELWSRNLVGLGNDLHGKIKN